MATFSTNLAVPLQPLLDACRAQSLAVESQTPLTADVVMWEASDRPAGSLSDAQVAGLITHIRTGGRLLLTSQPLPGLAPVQLGSILPSTGWGTQLRPSPYGARPAMQVGRVDTQFFGSALGGWAVPFCHDIRPTSAVERGQARYERYNFVQPWLKTPVAAGSDAWSRPLLNREWMVRAWCSDVAQMPLVVTGRYGAGRVVMVATSAAGMGSSAEASGLWTSLLRWLQVEDRVDRSNAAKPGLSVSFAQAGARVTVTNPSGAGLAVQVLGRAVAQTGAILADGSGEFQRAIQLAPRAAATVVMPLPGGSSIADEALGEDQPVQLRVGILSSDGSSLLAEQRVSSPAVPLQLKIETDNLRGAAYPFHAPGPEALVAFQGRMGAFVGAYAYLPGKTIEGSVVVSHGVTNLAPLGSVKDLGSPNNASVMALHDGATGLRVGPNGDKIDGYGMWTGKKGVENVVAFTLPANSLVTAVVLIGSYGPVGNFELHNPGQAVVEADQQRVASMENLDAAFASGYGQARIPMAPRRATTLTVRLPWVAKKEQRDRQEPWLGEIRVEGWCQEPPAAISGKLALHLVDALSGDRQTVLETAITLAPCSSQRIAFAAALPQGGGTRLYRLEAGLAQASAQAPVLAIAPSRTLLPLAEVRPPEAAGVGFNVSRGFREVSRIGTGTAELMQGWGMPDDLVWAYSRQLKESSLKDRTQASRLYVTQGDMRHYTTPWRSFSNGELFLPTTAGEIVEIRSRDPRWAKSDTALLMFVDRWDTGPDMSSLHGWQDYVEFDKWLRAAGKPGLQGQTLQAVGAEIETGQQSPWQVWQLSRYVQSIRSLREAFAGAGKKLILSAQGVPMVAGEPGRELALTIRGCSDDCTWGMIDNSPVPTTGRQMSELAFNPVWQMSTLSCWGHNSSLFNNWQWHTPVSTTEPSRRNMYDRAFRATLWSGGRYGSVHMYGYASNVGIAFTMTEDDFQQWWYLQERHSLISPEAPIGAGLVISTQKSADPEHLRFNCFDPLALDEVRLLTFAFRTLHEAGISLPFAANAASLKEWSGSAPLILLNLPDFSADEVEALKRLHARGTRMAAFAAKSSLSPDAAALFSQPGTLLLEGSPVALSAQDAARAASALHSVLALPVIFPEGTAGYGFRSQNLSFLVVEDWLEKGRHVELRVAKSGGGAAASACNMNDHQTLAVRSDGDHWVIELPLRSGDGVLVALEERERGS